MFNPFKLAQAMVSIFQRGLKYDRYITECEVMDLDAGKLLMVYRAAKQYRNTVGDWYNEEERTRDFKALCDALDSGEAKE